MDWDKLLVWLDLWEAGLVERWGLRPVCGLGRLLMGGTPMLHSVNRFDSQFLHLLIERVAVDAEEVGGFGFDIAAFG